MFELAAMQEVREAVGRLAAGFDPALVSAADAQAIVSEAAAAEHMLATVRALAARRMAETGVWRRDGDRSAAHHLARRCGTSVGKAREVLETAERMASLPALTAAARAGEVSPEQAAPIAAAAAASPGCEERLLHAARRASLAELRDHCARTQAAAEGDDAARQDVIHRSRHLRRRRLADGSGELVYRSTLEEVAEIFATAAGYADRRFRAARAEGRREPHEAYLADGLLDAVRAGRTTAPAGGDGGEPSASEPKADDEAEGDLATTLAATLASYAARPKPPPSPHKVIVRIDWEALWRGHREGDELCEIAGLGPVPVAAVRAMVASGDPFLAAVVTKGTDVATVAHLGRHPTAYQRTALEFRDPGCTALGCSSDVAPEYDHAIPWADTHCTLLEWLDRLCPHHHSLKTNQGWALVTGRGKREMVPPDDPRHPGNAHGPPAEVG